MIIDTEIAKILGLGKEEVLILQKLSTEPVRIADISKETRIPRTSLYYMLPKLLDRKLIVQIKIGGKIHWKRNTDENILNSYKKIIESLSNNTVGATKTISKESEVTIYIGASNLETVFSEIMKLPPKSRAYGIQPGISLLGVIQKMPLEHIIPFNKKLKQKQIIMEGIVHEKSLDAIEKILSKEDSKKLFESFGGRAADTAKLPEDFLDTTKAEIYLYDNKVALMNWHEEFGVIIKNKHLYNLVMEMFKSTKYLLQRYDQNEKIARKLVDLA
jgi:predicted transcriptional regulator